MANSLSQRSLGPMGLEPKGERVAKPVATRSDTVAIDICELIVKAFVIHGYTDEQAAAAFKTNYKVYLKAMNTAPNYDAYNPILKRLGQIPADVLKEFAGLLAEKVGLSSGIDSAKVEASVRVADAVLNLMKVSSR